MSVFHDEIEIEDFEYDEDTETYYFPCPCGDKFAISKVSEARGEEQKPESNVHFAASRVIRHKIGFKLMKLTFLLVKLETILESSKIFSSIIFII